VALSPWRGPMSLAALLSLGKKDDKPKPASNSAPSRPAPAARHLSAAELKMAQELAAKQSEELEKEHAEENANQDLKDTSRRDAVDMARNMVEATLLMKGKTPQGRRDDDKEWDKNPKDKYRDVRDEGRRDSSPPRRERRSRWGSDDSPERRRSRSRGRR